MIEKAFENSLDFARSLDEKDDLNRYRDEYYFPNHSSGQPIYLCGNSLGLQPKGVEAALKYEIDHWRTYAVEGHFEGKMPWMFYHHFLLPQTAKVVGAIKEEVVVMNTLTTNLHLLMVSFYRPTKKRYKIIMEAGAFPSDQYAMESQVRYHGFEPDDAIIEVAPLSGKTNLTTKQIADVITTHGDTVALIMFGGVNYYTGQYFDIEALTRAAHEVGAMAGFDLAHAAGNLPLKLHDWDVDFATWCSYKYLNAGPGGPSGLFVHKRHGDNMELPRFAGWWGHNEAERFKMKKGFQPMRGAAGWQLSNAQIFSFAAHKVGLDLFAEVGMEALRMKSISLTNYMEFLIEERNRNGGTFNIITPKDVSQRGAQLSILTGPDGKKLFNYLSKNGVFADWREPNVIRVAPVPMYNSFEDVFRFVSLLEGTKK